MAYEMVMPYHLHMPSYFLETFTEYPYYARCYYREHPAPLCLCRLIQFTIKMAYTILFFRDIY